jgi:ribosome-associated protein YbcJ (S4-like RNA binding protein)
VGVDIEIGADEDMIRLGQLLKFANVVSDGAEAKALLANDAVRVDGEVETRRGRQVSVGSVVEITTSTETVSLRVVHPAT